MLQMQLCKLLFLIFCSLFVVQISSSDVLEKFEYKYSMKPPLLIENNIPFWTSGGNVSLSDEKIRLASSLRSQKGAVWSERINSFNWWKIDVAFRIFGRQNIGADGLAFWFTTSRGDYNGNVYGSSDKWHGLGVFFDSYDNDRKQKNPKVMAIINDGTIEFDHANDGGKDIIGECFPNYRNKPYVTRAVIQYLENTLEIYFHNGESTNPNAFELCFKKDNVYLPQNGYFGVSAATGELADDHDLYHVLVTSLHKGEKQAEQPIDRKAQEEYDAYQKVFEEKQKKYLSDHPEIAEVLDQQRMMYEVPMQMNVEQINEFLSKIYDIVASVDQKISTVLQTQKSGNAGAAAPAGGAQPVDQSLISNINSLLYMNKETLSIVNELKNKLNSKMSDEKFQIDMMNAVNHLRQSSNQMMETKNSCSNTSCLTLPFFLFAIISQCAVIVGFIYYKHQSEAKAKKLY